MLSSVYFVCLRCLALSWPVVVLPCLVLSGIAVHGCVLSSYSRHLFVLSCLVLACLVIVMSCIVLSCTCLVLASS